MNKPYKQNEQGLTLVELLVTLTISMIFASTIYGVFISGINLYQQTSTIGNIRDEADYIVTSIMNEFYNEEPDYVEAFQDGSTVGVKLIRNPDKKVDRYIVEESDDPPTEVIISIVNDTFTIENTSKNEITTLNTNALQLGDNSYITIDCPNRTTNGTGRCYQGLVEIKIEAIPTRQTDDVDPILLNSSFGF